MNAHLESRLLLVAELAQDTAAMNDAEVTGDHDEARFRADLITRRATQASMPVLAALADRVMRLLGPPGALVQPDVGQAMLDLALALVREGRELS
ncbi:hypothetical protein FIV34_11695 [Luteibacter pinisoli]|uniref:Uncharacterized protein n=1 Tax=Luteibacter pinisoli TaxID=2589080 RepID=A0A4Y5Z407_9GAMM|nr:hypothetical protein [Luteibacter pinisoli]QDE39824.1 hypothetical protein FIV34_11695 [Luteibacter pinisoli]